MPDTDTTDIATSNESNVSQPSWRDVLAIHPAAEMFPRPSRDELIVLGNDVRANGLQSGIVIYSERNPSDPDADVGYPGDWLLDGISRLDGMEAVGLRVELQFVQKRGWSLMIDGTVLNVPQPKTVFSGHVDPYAYAISANIHRRHLTPELRQNLLIEIIARAPKKSDRQIGKEVGVDHKTIASARAKGEDVGRIPHVSTRTDTKGREQPATKTPPTKDPSISAIADRAEARSRENRRRQAAVGNGVDTQASAEQRKAEARAEPPTDDGFDALLAAWCAATDAAQERLLVTIGATRSNPHLVGEAECLRRVAPSAPVDDDPMPAIPDALRRRVAP
jgi:hypothetical protein